MLGDVEDRRTIVSMIRSRLFSRYAQTLESTPELDHDVDQFRVVVRKFEGTCERFRGLIVSLELRSMLDVAG